MHKTALTYGLLDKRLRALGFGALTQKGKARIYRHEQTGASIILPDAPFGEEVLPHHLVVARRVLKDHNLGDLDEGQVNPTKRYNQYPTGVESLKILVDDLIREYKKEHPDEAEDLEVFPPHWYGPPEDGLLKIGRSIFVIRDNKVEKELRQSEAPPGYWL